MKLSSKKGFSLVELIIVIAIMGIIAAVGVPAFQSILKNSQLKSDFRTAEGIAEAVATVWANADTNANNALSAKVVADKKRTWYSIDNVDNLIFGSINFDEYYKTASKPESCSDGSYIFTTVDGIGVVAISKSAVTNTVDIVNNEISNIPYDKSFKNKPVSGSPADKNYMIVAIDGIEVTKDTIEKYVISDAAYVK